MFQIYTNFYKNHFDVDKYLHYTKMSNGHLEMTSITNKYCPSSYPINLGYASNADDRETINICGRINRKGYARDIEEVES